MTDIYYRVLPLPAGIHSLCRKSPDGTYTIIINQNDPPSTWLGHFKHEIFHIKYADLDSPGDVQEIEARAHRRDNGKGEIQETA